MPDKELAYFAENAKGLEADGRLKLVLFSAGLKPATFVALKIDSKNMDEKGRIEHHLPLANISKPKGFEEITKIKGNKVYWEFKGIWFGYDIFKDKKTKKLFEKYIALVKKQKHKQADLIAGKIYGYPACCIKQFIKEHDKNYVRKRYTHYTYYKKLRDCEKKFPFIQHTACSTKCKASAKLNAKYTKAVKKLAPKFYKNFTAKKIHQTGLIVDTESRLRLKPIEKPVWQDYELDGHEYSMVSLKPFEGHHYLYGYLTKEKLNRGALFSGKSIRQHNFAEIKLGKQKKSFKTVIHYRKFAKP